MKLIADCKLALYNLPYKIREKFSRGKIDFNRFVTNSELGTDEMIANQYTPANPAVLKVLKDLHIKKTDTILDMGCGKGKAIHFMSKQPFDKMGGGRYIPGYDRYCKG